MGLAEGRGHIAVCCVTSAAADIGMLDGLRYELSGALRYLALRSYRVNITYKPAAHSTMADVQQVCSHKCEACRLAGLGALVNADSAEGGCAACVCV